MRSNSRSPRYDVITTASPRNFDYVKRLGAREAYDYGSKTVVADLVRALRGREVAGALAIGGGSAATCMDVVGACKGNRFVAVATPPTSFDNVPAGRGRLLRLAPAIARMLGGTAALTIKARRQGVKTKMIWGSALIANEVGPMIFEAFLPSALAEARFVTAPRPTVVGAGSAAACIAIVGACKGNRFVAMATPPTSFDDVPAGRGRWLRLAPAIARMLAGTLALTLKARRRGVKTKMIWGSTLIANEVGPMIFEEFLPAALAEARFVAAPSPTVMGAGLSAIPAALERQRRGVSAAKLVVTL